MLSALFILLILVVPTARSHALPTYASHSPVHGLINGLLRAEITRLSSTRSTGLHPQQRVASVPVVITSSRDVAAAVRAAGGVVEADVRGKVIAAHMPADRVEGLARQPGVRTVFPSLKYHLNLDQSIPEIRANQVWAETDRSGIPIQGRGVLVGLVDSGVDYRNPDFINPDGSSRIVSIWDQTTSGTAPAGYDFGNECDQSSIQSGTCSERDTDGHGTHVAGIALGNGRSGGSPLEIGVAPQAQLMVVKSDLSLDHIIAAWKYLTDRARALHEPIVINNSFGGSICPHDGSSPDSIAADQLAGPGRIFVAAAGNEGDQALHTSGTLMAGSSFTVSWTATGNEDTVSIGLFYRSDSKLDFTLTGTGRGESFHVSEGGSIEGQTTQDGRLKVTMESDSWDDEWSIFYVSLKAADSVTGSYQIQVSPLSVGSNPRYDAWIAQDDGAKFDRPDETDTVGSPADARSIIAVGNYATRISWTDHDGQTFNICTFAPCIGGQLNVGDIAAYSSVGPTSDGRHKPDISAPGTMIVSSLSRDASICGGHSPAECVDPKQISQDGLHLVETGTSMSSPHVAGTVALMLQVDPTLDPASALSMLQSSARHDQFTGLGWTATFGAGKLDALGAVQLAAPPATPTPTALPPTAAPTVTPTAMPTATAVRPFFNLVAIRVDRLGRSDGWRVLAPSPRVKPGTGLDLSIYTRYSNLQRNTSVTVTWRVYRAGTSAFEQAHSLSLSLLDNGMSWQHTRFTPRRAGVYSFVARVAMGSQVATKSVAFTVVKP